MSEERLIAVAAEDDRGLDGEIGAHFGRCPYYVLVETDDTTVTGSRVVANPYFDVHRRGSCRGSFGIWAPM
jgi:predicted Fe-Mo cluster-binding NifX family protein